MKIKRYRRRFNPGAVQGSPLEREMRGSRTPRAFPNLVNIHARSRAGNNEATWMIGDVTGLDMMDPKANVFFLSLGPSLLHSIPTSSSTPLL